MQQSQRARFNPALEFAIREANDRGLPVVVGFGLMDDYPEANARHYAFMLQGLQEVARDLIKRRIKFVMRKGSPGSVALGLARQASLVVCDRGYLRHQQQWCSRVAQAADCAVIQVEGDVVVPVEVASNKEEVGARTLRSKLHRTWDQFLTKLPAARVKKNGRSLRISGDSDPLDAEGTLARLQVDHGVRPVSRFRGGTSEARRRLDQFLRTDLAGYGTTRNEPADWQSSMLSPYLHFGQISPVEVGLAARQSRRGKKADREAFLEELIVRRELSMNFVRFNSKYDSFGCLPGWARKTLDEHGGDSRPHVYTRPQLESAKTHDPYWNAAMREMVHTGFMHNYMRMYWGKKILEWTKTPQAGYRRTLYLNNKYFLDGRDPNSYAGVAWCFGLHDRAWTERKIFGKVRYMNDRGLERKFDMERYIREVDALVEREHGE
jgi:deoxyribodipyrimidine photo-lyase